ADETRRRAHAGNAVPGRRPADRRQAFLPTPTVEEFAATDAAEPPDQPPTVRSVSEGLGGDPKSEPGGSPPPNSATGAFGKITAPAFFNFSATKESRSG